MLMKDVSQPTFVAVTTINNSLLIIAKDIRKPRSKRGAYSYESDSDDSPNIEISFLSFFLLVYSSYILDPPIILYFITTNRKKRVAFLDSY